MAGGVTCAAGGAHTLGPCGLFGKEGYVSLLQASAAQHFFLSVQSRGISNL